MGTKLCAGMSKLRPFGYGLLKRGRSIKVEGTDMLSGSLRVSKSFGISVPEDMSPSSKQV